ncbi:MAG TPA: aspartate aminotransferase family protein, partial [Candidatus Binatia bacterium]|nr:aspartate aminotransferase family protein [Candidatus Binatia bacterium]
MREYAERSLLLDAAARAANYLKALQGRAVAPSPEASAALSALNMPLPEHGHPAQEMLDVLQIVMEPATMA